MSGSTFTTDQLAGLNFSARNELLFQNGINFNDLPAWQKRGSGFDWEAFEKMGINPKTGETNVSSRWRIRRDEEVPIGEAYGKFILDLLDGCR